MERAALVPHPRWRRFVSRVTQPRVLVAIGALALLLGVGAIYASSSSSPTTTGTERDTHVGKIDPGDVKVAVLNGTADQRARGAGQLRPRLQRLRRDRDHEHDARARETLVLYADGQKRPRRRSRATSGSRVQPLDKQTRDLAGGADVVVIAGEDRA